jgi:predicted metal-dependent HD superfamily phosphohydrolase
MNLQELLNKWNIKCDINTLLSMWNESHRHYHNLNHLNDLIDQINENKSKFSEKEYEKLMLAALFHDCVYDPMSSTNEEDSADFFLECSVDKSNSDVLEVKQMILDTKYHNSITNLSESFNKFDMSIVERDFDQLLEWETGIREEYSGYEKDVYKRGRLKFLESLMDNYPNNTKNLLKLVECVKNNY